MPKTGLLLLLAYVHQNPIEQNNCMRKRSFIIINLITSSIEPPVKNYIMNHLSFTTHTFLQIPIENRIILKRC